VLRLTANIWLLLGNCRCAPGFAIAASSDTQGNMVSYDDNGAAYTVIFVVLAGWWGFWGYRSYMKGKVSRLQAIIEEAKTASYMSKVHSTAIGPSFHAFDGL